MKHLDAAPPLAVTSTIDLSQSVSSCELESLRLEEAPGQSLTAHQRSDAEASIPIRVQGDSWPAGWSDLGDGIRRQTEVAVKEIRQRSHLSEAVSLENVHLTLIRHQSPLQKRKHL